MVSAVERVLINVRDIREAAGHYESLLGMAAVHAELPGTGQVAWFGLGNTVLQLQSPEDHSGEAFIAGLIFSGAPPGGAIDNDMGLELSISDGSVREENAWPPPECEFIVDHLVLRTVQAESCIALFNERLGIRLALDRMVPEWGGRMLFFRTGKLTIEVIASEKVEANSFWGIAYQCPDLERSTKRLESAAVRVSEIRDGRKPGTRVATVKSHCLDIPTLLIEPAT